MKNDILKLFYGYTEKCRLCGQDVNTDAIFKYQPNFLFIESANSTIFMKKLPKEIVISDRRFKMLCATLHTQFSDGHFIGVFNLNKNLFVVDDLNQSVKKMQSKSKYNNELVVTGTLYHLI